MRSWSAIRTRPSTPWTCKAADASRYLAERTGIEHHSPQVIVTRGGKPAYDASHFSVRADELEQQLG